jgi:Fur family ferric uptake transcriptional regulator
VQREAGRAGGPIGVTGAVAAYCRPMAMTVDELVARLRAAGVRITAPRRMVLSALVESGSHVTADELHRRVQRDHPEVSASSIYRTMELLTEHGVVEHLHLGHGPAQYHLTDERHAHLVCNGCGAIVELDPELSAPFADRIADHLGFDLDLGHFALTGWCAPCRPQRLGGHGGA